MSDTKDCSNCVSKCKKDSPCSFYQKDKRSNLEKLMDELNISHNTNNETYYTGGVLEEAEIGELNSIHEEEMEAMYREDMELLSREQLEAIADGGNDGE